MQHPGHQNSISKRYLVSDRSKINSMGIWYRPLALCLSPVMQATHTHSSAWCCPRINCTPLSWDDIQATQSKVSEGWKGKWAWFIKPRGTYHLTRLTSAVEKSYSAWFTEGEGCQFNSLGLAVTPHECKAPESLAWNCNKAIWKMIVSFFFLINSFIYFWLRWVFIATHRLSLVAASGG